MFNCWLIINYNNVISVLLNVRKNNEITNICIIIIIIFLIRLIIINNNIVYICTVDEHNSIKKCKSKIYVINKMSDNILIQSISEKREQEKNKIWMIRV